MMSTSAAARKAMDAMGCTYVTEKDVDRRGRGGRRVAQRDRFVGSDLTLRPPRPLRFPFAISCSNRRNHSYVYAPDAMLQASPGSGGPLGDRKLAGGLPLPGGSPAGRGLLEGAVQDLVDALQEPELDSGSPSLYLASNASISSSEIWKFVPRRFSMVLLKSRSPRAEASFSTPSVPVTSRPRPRATSRAAFSSTNNLSALVSMARQTASRSPSPSCIANSSCCGRRISSQGGGFATHAPTEGGAAGFLSSLRTDSGTRTLPKSPGKTSTLSMGTR